MTEEAKASREAAEETERNNQRFSVNLGLGIPPYWPLNNDLWPPLDLTLCCFYFICSTTWFHIYKDESGLTTQIYQGLGLHLGTEQPIQVVSDSLLPQEPCGDQVDTLMLCSPSQLLTTDAALNTLRDLDQHDRATEEEAH